MSAAKDARPIEPGDRFEDRDRRSAGRVVQVLDAPRRWGKLRVQVEVHPLNPEAVGRKVFVSEDTLRTKYRRVSR